MKGYIEERAIEIARYIIDNNTTVRQAAKHFGISKSTVHKDVTERLEKINASLAAETRKVLDVNKSERHIRGGLATKEKYLHMHGERCKAGNIPFGKRFVGKYLLNLTWLSITSIKNYK